MRRLCVAALATALLAALAVGFGGSALAYFTSVGSGSASAAVTKLNAPTISSATPAVGGTVTVNWGAVTPPGTGSVTYYVTRGGGKPAGNCPTVSAPTTVLTCKDSGLSVAEHTYTVTAVWKTWSAVSGTKTAKVTVGEATKFTISASPTTQVAGEPINLTITAKDANDSTVTTYTGSHSLTFSGASASGGGNAATVANASGTPVNFGTATPLTFASGVVTVSGTKNGVLRIYKPGAANIVATEGALSTPAPAAVTINPVAATKFVLTAASATPAAGATDDLTITAQDAFGNTVTSHTGSHNLVFSGATASGSGALPTVTDSGGTEVAFGGATAVVFNAGVAVGGAGVGGTMKLPKSGSTTIKATEGTIVTPTGVTVTVTPGAATKLALSAATATPVAGTGFNLTTTAQDVFGNTATTYTGSKAIAFSGAVASPSGALPTVVDANNIAVNFGSPTTLTFSAGAATPASSKNGFAKLTKAGATSISATDGTLSTATPLALTVSPGVANRVALLELTASAGSIGSPCLFTCAITTLGNSGTVKAKAMITDASGNTVSNIGAVKTVNVTVTSGGTIAGSPLSIPATGAAVSATEFTYTAPASGGFTHISTAASSGYTSATATATK